MAAALGHSIIILLAAVQDRVAFLVQVELLHQPPRVLLVANVRSAALHEADCVLVEPKILRELDVVYLTTDPVAAFLWHLALILGELSCSSIELAQLGDPADLLLCQSAVVRQ